MRKKWTINVSQTRLKYAPKFGLEEIKNLLE